MPSLPEMKNFSERLIQWGTKEGRNALPWKEKNNGMFDPYKIWVSETMLQQTKLAVVMPKFKHFMEKFPNIEKLANSSVDEVISVWSGLGYYRRARNLHKGAKVILNDRQKVFPKNAIDWETIPGVGASTSAAISSFTNSERVAILDTNVTRVLSRRYCLNEVNPKMKEKKALLSLAIKLLPQKNSEMPLYSQYIMDLGALVCKPVSPACERCPVSDDCESFTSETVELYPKKTKKILKERKLTWVLAMDREKVILEKQTEEKLWKSLFVPASNIKMKENKRLPRKRFFRSYRLKVSNCDLTVDVWKRECVFDKIKLSGKHQIARKTANKKVPMPKILEKILQDSSFWILSS